MEYKKLGELFKISSGGTPSKKIDEFYSGGNIPWIKTGDLKVKDIYSSSEYITEYAVKNSSAKLFPKNTVLIAMYGATIGATSILRIDATTNQACCAFLPSDRILPEYLYYFFKVNKEKIVKMGVGGAQPNISASILKEIEIPVIDLEKQIKIINILDKSQDLINKRNEQIEDLDELVKSKFIEMFGNDGKKVNLIDYVWFQEGPGVRSVDFREEGTILLTGSNINDNEISFGYKNDRYISNELANGKYNHFICDKDDILVVSSAITPGKFDKKVVVVKEDNKYCLNTGIIRFKPDLDYLTIDYFREFLKTDFFKYQVIKEMRGIAQMHFGPSHLKNMKILLPDSIELQNQFADFVKKVDEMKLKMEKSLKELEDNFNSLMQKAFKGELF